MARALFGYVDSPSDRRTQEVEIARLRGRVRELEAEIAELRGEAAARDSIERQLAALSEDAAGALA